MNRAYRTVSVCFAELANKLLLEPYAKANGFGASTFESISRLLESSDSTSLTDSERTSFNQCFGLYRLMLSELELNNRDQFPTQTILEMTLGDDSSNTPTAWGDDKAGFDQAARRLLELNEGGVLDISPDVFRKTIVLLRSNAVQSELQQQIDASLGTLWAERNIRLKPWIQIEKNRVSLKPETAAEILGPENIAQAGALATTLKYMLLLESQNQFIPTLQETGFLLLIFKHSRMEPFKDSSLGHVNWHPFAQHLFNLHRFKIKALSIHSEITDEDWNEFSTSIAALHAPKSGIAESGAAPIREVA